MNAVRGALLVAPLAWLLGCDAILGLGNYQDGSHGGGGTAVTSGSGASVGPGGAGGANSSGVGAGGVGTSAYANAVQALTPIAYWRLEETSALDPALNIGSLVGLDGTYNAVTLPSAGLIAEGGSAALFADVLQSNIEVPNQMQLHFAGNAPFSLELWTHADAAPIGSYGLLTMNGSWELTVSSSNAIQMFRGAQIGGGQSLPVAATAHIVVSYDGASLCVYLDGGAGICIADSDPIVPTNNGTPLLIGARGGASPYDAFFGTIDEVAIYDTALAASQVQQHYLLGSGR